MDSRQMFADLGYAIIEDANQIVFTKGEDLALGSTLTRKIIFDTTRQTVQIKGRTRQGGVACPRVDANVLVAIGKMFAEQGWEGGE